MTPASPVSELAPLLGVRSSKGRYYSEYRHSKHDLERTLDAVGRVSWALAAASGDGADLAASTLPVVAQLLGAQAVLLVADHPGLGSRTARLLSGHPAAEEPVDAPVREVLEEAAGAVGDSPAGALRGAPQISCSLLVVPFPRAGEPCGAVVAAVPLLARPDGTDLAILRTVTNQLAGAVETRYRAAESETMRLAADVARREVGQTAGVLAQRERVLQRTRSELVGAREAQVRAEERQRIARDLHDSVAQHVLSMGMQVEWCRTTCTDQEVVERLTEVKELARTTVHRIREAIFGMSAEAAPPRLVDGLRAVVAQHRVHGLALVLRERGEALELPPAQVHALLMAAKEAVFNAVLHAEAERVTVSLTWGVREVRVQVSDDGRGSAAHLRECLGRARQGCADGYHRGLSNMEERMRMAGGRLSLSDGPRGGVRVLIAVPRP